MSRALTRVYDVRGGRLRAVIFRCDSGYPAHHGFELRSLAELQIQGGLTGGEDIGTHANGMGCLAAQLISGLKERVGGVSVTCDPGIGGCEYVYDLWASEPRSPGKNAHVILRAVRMRADAEELLYEGPITLFDPGAYDDDE